MPFLFHASKGHNIDTGASPWKRYCCNKTIALEAEGGKGGDFSDRMIRFRGDAPELSLLSLRTVLVAHRAAKIQELTQDC